MPESRPELRQGLVYGLAAYAMWGLLPLYWPLLRPADAFEILGHRVIWSLIGVLALVLALRRRERLREIWRNPRTRITLACAAVLVTGNWAIYIWGVTNQRVIETALGYFISPLFLVLLGVVVLGERLRRWQWAALSLVALAIVVIALDYGRLPWVALGLVGSWGCYGLVKKHAGLGGVESLTFETLLATPAAVALLAFLHQRGDAEFGHHGWGHALLVASSGIATALPLLFFAEAATRVPLSTLGLMQYLAPTIQFLLGVFWFGEPMPPSRLIGFALVWTALALFTAESLRHRRAAMALARGVGGEA
ncbi:MAG: EamA family transporter RarD [Nocardioides sp.]